MTFLAAFLAMTLFVALKAIQQRVVMQAQYPAMLGMGLLIAFAEVYVIHAVATEGYSLPLVLSIGAGGGIGAMCGTYIHRRFSHA